MPREPVLREEEFWAMASWAPGGCLEWQGRTNQDGYGLTGWLQLKTAHRVAAKLVWGTAPENLETMHSCNNARCINPAHLSYGTHTENNRYRVASGRWDGGARARLDLVQRDELVRRYRAGEDVQVLATAYGIGQRTAYRYIKGEHRRRTPLSTAKQSD